MVVREAYKERKGRVSKGRVCYDRCMDVVHVFMVAALAVSGGVFTYSVIKLFAMLAVAVLCDDEDEDDCDE